MRLALVARGVFISLVLLASGCAVHVNDQSFLRPTSGSELDASAVANALPGFNLINDHVVTRDGIRLYRARLSRPGTRNIVLFFGGNLSTVQRIAVSTTRELSEALNADFVFVDYRGYGQSGGSPGVDTLRADALALFDEERIRATEQKKALFVAGHSLGSVVAGALVEQRRPDAAILFTTITTPAEVVGTALPWYARIATNVTFDPALMQIDNIRSLNQYEGPVLLIGAANDRQTPASLTTRLFEALKKPRKHLEMVIVDSGHNDVMRNPQTKAALRSFLAAIQAPAVSLQ